MFSLKVGSIKIVLLAERAALYACSIKTEVLKDRTLAVCFWGMRIFRNGGKDFKIARAFCKITHLFMWRIHIRQTPLEGDQLHLLKNKVYERRILSILQLVLLCILKIGNS